MHHSAAAKPGAGHGPLPPAQCLPEDGASVGLSTYDRIYLNQQILTRDLTRVGFWPVPTRTWTTLEGSPSMLPPGASCMPTCPSLMPLWILRFSFQPGLSNIQSMNGPVLHRGVVAAPPCSMASCVHDAVGYVHKISSMTGAQAIEPQSCPDAMLCH